MSNVYDPILGLKHRTPVVTDVLPMTLNALYFSLLSDYVKTSLINKYILAMKQMFLYILIDFSECINFKVIQTKY